MTEKKLCNSCGMLTYIYQKKKQQCQYCWKKERAVIWKENSKPKKVTPIKAQSKKGARTANKDSIFFHSIWDNAIHNCENCTKYLGDDYNPVYFSHILTKGAYPQFRYETNNINILCFKCHQEWEFGKKKMMPIYSKNIKIIREMKSLLTISL